jgi:NAD(P)-dependent dehydrogenase (short-subunit alcohol dehydrogenase family)
MLTAAIGAAIAGRFAEEGAQVIVDVSIDAARSIARAGRRVRYRR